MVRTAPKYAPICVTPQPRLHPWVDEIVGDHQCEYWGKRSTADDMFLHLSVTGENGSTMRQYISYS
jgi:hypothetical protein